MQAKIGVLPAYGCDRAAVGIIFELLRKKWPDEVFLVWWPIPSVYPPFDVPVLVLVANDKEMLCKMRAETPVVDGGYVCGLCLGGVSTLLVELPNFTIHTDVESLLSDLMAVFEEKVKS